jgi:predicted ATPase/class 3 adenylate cyclase
MQHADDVPLPTGKVSLLFSDIEGSTTLWERNPAEMTIALQRHDAIIREAVESAGGRVFKTTGDGFHAVFTSPVECLIAAAAAQRSLQLEEWPRETPIKVRMGLHSGLCEQRDDDYFGPVMNRTARLMDVAHGGQTVVSRVMVDLAQDVSPQGLNFLDLGEHRLKDLSRPERVFQLEVEGMAVEFPPLRSLNDGTREHNLPVLVSSFVGRETEVVEVHQLVQSSRLVTLTGAGGSGKTRLALQVTADFLDEFPEGVWLIELASLAEPALVTSTVASTLGVREEPGRPLLQTLVNALSDRRLLVVLDNCEHVLVPSATLADTLLRSCPGLSVLATSREPLGVNGEHVYRVPSLSLPEPGQILLPEQARSFDAVQLFVERAAAHDSTFQLNSDSAATVVALCQKLDGMPLAIELAAARVASLSIEQIERRLDDRLRLLTRGNRTALPRHQTLRALIDWSYDLLDEREQAVLCRLSTFVGGWNLEAAEAVCPQAGPHPLDVMDVLGSLVDKSLVQVDPASVGARRYRLLETIRHYCAENFSNLAPADRASTKLAHAVFFLDLAEEAAPHLRGSEWAPWFDRIGLELGNLRAAMAHFASDPTSIDQAMRIWIALEVFWTWELSPGVEELEAVLSKANDEPLRGLRARALVTVAKLRFKYGDYAIAQAQLEAALKTGRSICDRALMAMALGWSSLVALRQGNTTTALDMAQEAVELAIASGDLAVIAEALHHRGDAKSACNVSTDRFDFEEALAGFREVDDRFGISNVLQSLAIRELKDGNLEAARARINESFDLLGRELPEPSYGTLTLLGLVELLDGNAPAAFRAYRELLAAARHGGSKPYTGYAFLGLGFCSTVADDPHRAAGLHGAADALFESLGEALDPDLLSLRTRDHRQLRRNLGDKAFEADYQAGRNLMPQSAIDLAMQEQISD